MDDAYWQGVIRKCVEQANDLYRRTKQDEEGDDEEAKAIWVPFNKECAQAYERQIDRIAKYLRERKEAKRGRRVNLPGMRQ